MNLIKVSKNYQITIPRNLRKKLNISQGDYMEVNGQNGEIVIRPVKMVHPDQAYFFSKEWQKGEAEADKDIAEGRVEGPFNNAEDLIKDLES